MHSSLSHACSSVQFSSVQFSSNGVPRRPSLPDPSGTSDREGTARHNWHGWTSGAGMVWLPLVPRVERARPASDEFFWRFGVLGQTRARQGGNGGWRRLAERAVVGATECAPYTLPKHHISRMRARPTHRCLQHSVGAAAARESSRERRCVRDGAGGGSSDGAGGGSDRLAAATVARADRRLAEDEASVS